MGRTFVWGGADVSELAARFGTPLYVFDETMLRDRCRRLCGAAISRGATVYYAGKAFLPLAMARLVVGEGLGLDVVSLGELAMAEAAGVPACRIELHGNAKTVALLSRALSLGVGRIVVDSTGELQRIASMARAVQCRPKVLLRLSPGIDIDVHQAVRTATVDCKFGVPLGELSSLIATFGPSSPVDLAGLHVHLGSQIAHLDAFLRGARSMVERLVRLRDETGFEARELDLGGGFAVWDETGAPLDAGRFITAICDETARACTEVGLTIPHLSFEPGRWIASPSGITVYQVQSVKRATGGRYYAALDGGMTDNPRPCLYGARYDALLASDLDRPGRETVTLAGPCCESGDLLIEDVSLPPLKYGDLIVLPDSGAYTYSMFMTYNGALRPAVLFVKQGVARQVVRRWTTDDLLRDQTDGKEESS